MADDQQLLEALGFIRQGGQVRRFHNVQTTRMESVAEHSFHVAWLCYILAERKPSKDLVLAALAHDLPEGTLGDLPAPTKRLIGAPLQKLEEQMLDKFGLNFKLNESDRNIMKQADILDGMLYCLKERTLGNCTGDLYSVYTTYRSYLSGIDKVPMAWVLMKHIHTLWEELNNGSE